jgi:NADH-quinone oxidoreductase subunit N
MSWLLFFPELFYFGGGMAFLCLSMSNRSNPRRDYYTALVLAALGVVICLATVNLEGSLFFNTYRVDLFSQVFKLILALGLFLIISICSELNAISARYHPEFYFLLFVCTLAMMLLVSSVHILTIYVALELSSYSLYILVALRRDEKMSLEAGIKYFLVGIFASAIMLFGVALLYSTTQATFIADMVRVLPGILDSSIHRRHLSECS